MSDFVWDSRRAVKAHKMLNAGRDKLRLASAHKRSSHAEDDPLKDYELKKKPQPAKVIQFVTDKDFYRMIEMEQRKARQAVEEIEMYEGWQAQWAKEKEERELEETVANMKKQMDLLGYKLDFLRAIGL